MNIIKQIIKSYTSYVCFCCFSILHLNAQPGVKIGANEPAHPSAILDMNIENHGVLFPSVGITNASISDPVLSPAIGLLVFAEAGESNGLKGKGFYYWDSKWKKM